MGIATVIPTADFSLSNIGNSIFPITDGLVGLFYPGTDNATTVENHVSGGAATIVGSPVYAANFATFNNNSPGVAALAIATPLTTDYTLVIVAKEIDGNSDSYVFSQTGENTFSFIGNTVGAARFASFPQSANFDVPILDLLNVDPAKFGLYGYRRAPTKGAFTQAFAGAVRTREETFFTARSASAGILYIGAASATGSNQGTGDRTTDIACVAVFNRYLSDVEMVKLASGLAEVMSFKGISDL